MGRIDSDTLYGTLSLLILQTLADEALHGLEIQRRIHDTAGTSLQVEEGALYPALHRLERDGFLSSDWGISTKKSNPTKKSTTVKKLPRRGGRSSMPSPRLDPGTSKGPRRVGWPMSEPFSGCWGNRWVSRWMKGFK